MSPVEYLDQSNPQRRKFTILICTTGSRGDVQPFLALSQGLKSRRNGKFKIIFGTHSEYAEFVDKYGGDSVDVSFSLDPSLARMVMETDRGREAKRSRSLFSLNLGALRDTAGELYKGWFHGVKSAIEQHGPVDVIVLSYWTVNSGVLAYIQSLPKGIRPRVLILYAYPSTPTGEHLPPHSNFGVTLPFAFLNKLAWHVESKIMHGSVMHPLATALCDSHGVPHWPPNGNDPKHAIGDEPTWAAFCIHSPSMLPRPKDWPANHDTIGFLHTPLDDPLPLDLATFIKAAEVDRVPLAFIGLGSALWVGFDSKDDSQRALQALYDGAVSASSSLATAGFKVILQTVTTPAGDFLTPTLDPAAKDVIFVLSQSASHDMIFPHCAVVASHGGVGTLQTTLLHGAVPVIFPCIPTGDEPFWASFVRHRGLGVHGGLALTMSAESVAKAFRVAFAGLDRYRVNVENVRCGMVKERPADRVLEWIEAE